MADRSNARLNEAIEQHIAQWDGTVHGFCIKNMWENGADYESICEAANIDIEDYEDDSLGVPSCSRMPSCMTPMRSDILMASS